MLDRDWMTDCSVAPTAEVTPEAVRIEGVRDFAWRTTRDFDARWTTEEYRLDELVGVWYFVEHFHKIRGIAHVMLSFEFAGDRFAVCSFEARREKGERYHPWRGLWRSYELGLVWGTEEDLIRLRTNVRNSKVLAFPCVVPPGKGQDLFVRLCNRANALATQPEWYHTLTTTCTTSLVEVVNEVTPRRVPFVWRVLLPGHTPRAVHRLKLVQDQGGYEATLAHADITERARAHGDAPGFSRAIRS